MKKITNFRGKKSHFGPIFQALLFSLMEYVDCISKEHLNCFIEKGFILLKKLSRKNFIRLDWRKLQVLLQKYNIIPKSFEAQLKAD
jgi:hypothetical protein